MKFLIGVYIMEHRHSDVDEVQKISTSLLRISQISFTLRTYGRFVINMETLLTLSFRIGDQSGVVHKDSRVYGYSNSYAHAVKIGPQSKMWRRRTNRQ
ncbi:hypothetical protein Tco_0687425 [Tanacetum coccineum]